MLVLLSPKADKEYKRINEPDKTRLNKTLIKLSKNPPEGDIKKLAGRDGYRARTGGWRILFDIDHEYVNDNGEKGAIIVYEISPRGGVYKGA